MAQRNKKYKVNDVKVEKTQITFEDISFLLKEGKVLEYVLEKDKKIKEWKENRYRICNRCNLTKLRKLFQTNSATCKDCKREIKAEYKKIKKNEIKKKNKKHLC